MSDSADRCPPDPRAVLKRIEALEAQSHFHAIHSQRMARSIEELGQAIELIGRLTTSLSAAARAALERQQP